jgi:hypothetical protein
LRPGHVRGRRPCPLWSARIRPGRQRCRRPAYRPEMWCRCWRRARSATWATCCEVMHHVDQVTQLATKPGQLPNETDRGPKERLSNLSGSRPGAYANEAARFTGGQKRATRRSVGVARVNWPIWAHAERLATSLLTGRAGPFRSPYEKGNGTVLEQ